MSNILNSMTDGVATYDHEWRFTFVNQPAANILGKAPDDLMGQNLWDVCSNATLDTLKSTFYQEFHRAVEDQISVYFQEFCFLQSIWLDVYAYPFQDGLMVLYHDVSDRKQLEIVLQQTCHQLATQVQAQTVELTRVKAALEVQHAHCQRVEQECDQLLNHTQTAQVRAERAEQHCAFLAETSAVLASVLDHKTALTHVAELAVPFLADYCLIHRFEQDGQLLAVAALHRDPAQQKWVEELAYLEQGNIQIPTGLLAQVLRTGEPMLVAEPIQTIQTSLQDERSLELYDNLTPRSMMLVPLIAYGQVLGAITLAVASNRCYQMSDLTLATDLAQRIGLAIDNAQLRQKNQEAHLLKEEFLSIISHELRTPLNAILGWAQMLVRQRLDEKTIRLALETIERKARAQVQTIRDLVTASRVVTGQFRLHPVWVDLRLVIQEAIASLAVAAETKIIRLDTKFDDWVGSIWGDPQYLRQIVWNLISNAIKFTPRHGRVEIHLTQGENFVQFCVTDTGQGIKTDFLPYVFDRFRQADSSITRTHGGLGLGLAIVRHLVDLHGGQVEVESRGTDQGATFRVHLPIPLGVPVSQATPPLPAAAIAPSQLELNNLQLLDGLNLLVVSNDPPSRELLTLVLEEYGAAVTAAASTRDALDTLEHLRPDILIMDVHESDRDSRWFMSRMRMLETEQDRKTPTIALTASQMSHACAKASVPEFQHCLAKPIEPITLAAAVATIAGQERSPDE